MTYENRAITNRGFIHGPFCTIYGLGALSVYFLLKPISEHYVAIFVCGMLLATIIEMLTAKLMTRLFGGFWWNYDNKRFNYRGVICLQSSLCWGVMSLCTFIIFQPMVEAIVDTYYLAYGKFVAVALVLGYMVDFVLSFRSAVRDRNEVIETELDTLSN